ncbi:MAG: hypothetical protein H0X29_09805 [Parachlamydiaceae bacterium]|nr:hypothetical protein [Parachlamydiaceae bacterium]
MDWIAGNILRGDFLHLPGVRTAAVIGVTSTTMAVGLHILGYPCKENVTTAVFAAAGTGGILVTTISAVAYSIFLWECNELMEGN